MRSLTTVICILACTISEGVQYRTRQQDVVFVLNNSGDYSEFYGGTEIIRLLLYRVSVAPSNTRVALITYGDGLRIHRDLKGTVNRENVLEILEKLRPSENKATRSLNNALGKVREMLTKQYRKVIFQNKNGYYRTSRNPVHRIIVIIETTGKLKDLQRFYAKSLASDPSITFYIFSFKSPSICKAKVYKYLLGKKSFCMVIKNKSSFKRAIRHAYKTKPFSGLYGHCRAGKKFLYDECNRRCKCSRDGILYDCYRIRKEFTQLSIKERIRYINAYFALTTLASMKTEFESYIKIHQQYFCSGIHTRNYFFPWHRWYVVAMENILRAIDCRITVPYWDWAYWHPIAWKTGVHIWGSKRYQLGGDGVEAEGYCVMDGPFAKGLWKTASWDDPREIIDSTIGIIRPSQKVQDMLKGVNNTYCLRRKFNHMTPSVFQVNTALELSSNEFHKFEIIIRLSFHNMIHNAIGGNMCTMYASVSPEFFMHHGILDKIWYQWQKKSPDRKYVFFHNKTKTMSHLECDHSPASLIDSSSLPFQVKVLYTRFPSGNAKREDLLMEGRLFYSRKSNMQYGRSTHTICGNVDDEDVLEAKEFEKATTPVYNLQGNNN